MPIDLRSLLPFVLMLAPFIYSNDHSKTRVYEVLAVGGVFVVAAIFSPIRIRREADWLILLAYTIVLILQQFVISDGSFRFGAQYALVMAAAFIPGWVARSVVWRPSDFETYWDRAIGIASVILVLNLVGSRFLGFGEHFSGLQGARYFGFLGDSISPVLIFPLTYYFLGRRYAWAGLIAFGLMLTGGKAAFVMLVVALCLTFLMRASWWIRVISLPLFVFIGAFGFPAAMSTLQSSSVQYSWNTRLISYELGWRLFVENPIFGVGINRSMVNLSSYAEAFANSRQITHYWVVGQIHNAFIRSLAETGILGFLVLLAFCLLLIYRALVAAERVRRLPRSKGQALATAGAVWTIAFITTYQSTGWFEHGHPQFAWLLLISSASYAASGIYRSENPSARQRTPFWNDQVVLRS
ncbi:MAG: O-antigen ligase family protein [Gallionella sp.]|nr:O-antigen ligase family protein [Gallionella sp.]